jgi:PTS system nitrogen regulatory IIA component
MNIIDFISADAVVPDFKASNKRQALQILGRKAADIAGLEQHLVMDVLMERERLGSTGVGAGVAIPHGKVANLNKLYGVFGKTDEAIEFDSIDEQPVDLIFLLLAPDIEGADHLKALSQISRVMNDRQMCGKLRKLNSRDDIYTLLIEATDQK